MSFSFSDSPDQSGRTAIVTGANTGIGREIARHLAMRNARVVLACRDEGKADEAIATIERSVPGARLAFLPLDLGDLASVREAAERAKDEERIDLLIDNAGVMIPPLGHALGGCELQFAVNHLGHFAFTLLLLDKLEADGGARIVVQSSVAHRRGSIKFDNLDASQGYERRRFYSQSKLANLLFAFELDRRLRAAGSLVSALACHPGVAQTDLMRHERLANSLIPLFGAILNTAENGALPALQAATDPEATGGDYYGPWGAMELRGSRSGRAFATRRARDEELARRLWERSVELTGVDLPFEPAAS